ncbi:MAG: hypothetical protein OXN84_18830 [Albidovulum sp.]|nr:hypothetical protein [Albidovulum sp.]
MTRGAFLNALLVHDLRKPSSIDKFLTLQPELSTAEAGAFASCRSVREAPCAILRCDPPIVVDSRLNFLDSRSSAGRMIAEFKLRPSIGCVSGKKFWTGTAGPGAKDPYSF